MRPRASDAAHELEFRRNSWRGRLRRNDPPGRQEIERHAECVSPRDGRNRPILLCRRILRFRLLLRCFSAHPQRRGCLFVSDGSLARAEPHGILRCQINSLPKTAKRYTTWEGVRISAAEVTEFASTNDFQLLALEGLGTQYMWITMRKQPKGWFSALAANPPRATASIRNIVNAHSGEPIVPVRGRFACMGIWIEEMPDDCDLNQINIEVEGEQAAPIYIGPSAFPGLWQLNAIMPAKGRTGLVPVEVFWFGEPLCEPAWMRVAPAGPAVPRLTSLNDGVNLLSGSRITSRSVKLFLEELEEPEQLEVRVDGAVIEDLDVFCKDPVNERFEITFTLPDSVRAGSHWVELRLGSRLFPAAPFEVM